MATIKIWAVHESTWERPVWGTDEDWYSPFADDIITYYLNHETAHDAIVKRVAIGCDKRNGKVTRHENSSDGYVFYEWTEEYDGIMYRKWLQIAANGIDVITD